MISEICIRLCDHLNPGFGFEISILDEFGGRILHTSTHPIDGRDLDLQDCLDIARYYAPKEIK